jgi:hypothetical protein
MMPTYEESLARAQAAQQTRADVVTIAKAVRGGSCEIFIKPVNNGFLVYVGEYATVVTTKANDVGLLVRALYSGDLDNEDILKRIRRLMGYN